MKKIVIFTLMVLFLLSGISYAGCEAALTGVVVTVTCDEPITNEDDSDLTDLAGINMYYDMGEGWVGCEGNPVSATSPTGGGTVSSDCTVPVLERMEKDVNFKANACDLSQNCSLDSDIIVKRIDRLAPKRME